MPPSVSGPASSGFSIAFPSENEGFHWPKNGTVLDRIRIATDNLITVRHGKDSEKRRDDHTNLKVLNHWMMVGDS